MRVILRLVAALAVFAVMLVAASFLLPQKVVVARSVTIAAPPAAVYAEVSSLQKFSEWSPWSDLDPAMKVTFEGPSDGVGARMTWASDKANVGKGAQEIVATTPDERVESKLTFDGMPPASAYFDLEPDGEGTKVTWTLATDMGMNPVGRWMGLMMDEWVGADYEKGLAALKAKVEGA